MFELLPLLLYGLLFALSVSFALTKNFLLPALLLILLSYKPRTGWMIVIAGFTWGACHIPAKAPSDGEHLFLVHHISKKGQSFYFKGEIEGHHFTTFRLKELPEELTDKLWVDGYLKNGELILRKKPLALETTSFSLHRFRLKEWTKLKILEYTPHKRSGELLAALITGDLDNKIVKKDFARFGLQHILAISGFHFSFLAMGIAFLLGRFIPYRILPLLLIFLLASYFLFLGPSASIIRAWMAILIASLAELKEKRPSALNSLGVGLLAVGLWNPQAYLEAGFILSFVLTASILLYAKPFEDLLKKYFRPRSFKTVKEASPSTQLALFILSFLRKSISLNAAVLFSAIPLTLYFFKAFPLLSLFFNLFYPTLIAISLFLFLLSFIPGVLFLNSYYLDSILNLIHEVPLDVDGLIQIDYLKVEFVIIYISIFLFWGLYKKDKRAYDSYSI